MTSHSDQLSPIGAGLNIHEPGDTFVDASETEDRLPPLSDLVTDDLIGLTNSKIKFVKEFGNVRKTIRDAVKKYKTEVQSLKYPSKKYLY